MPEEQCVRMKRSEYEALRCLLGAVSYTAHANDDLKDRVLMIPHGKRRMAMVLGGIRALANDLIGTIPVGQCKQIRNTMKDMDMRMVPKLSAMSQNVILEKDIAKGLVDAAMEKCKTCVESPEESLKCPLYKLLESFLPLDTYDNGMLCPYSTSKWED